MLIQNVEKTVAGGSRGKTQMLLPSVLGVAQAEIIKMTKKKKKSQPSHLFYYTTTIFRNETASKLSPVKNMLFKPAHLFRAYPGWQNHLHTHLK